MYIKCIAIAVCQGRHDWNFMLHQHPGKVVLFQDGLVGPAVRTVELGGQGSGVGANAVDTIFITVQGQEFACAVIIVDFNGIENYIWREGIVRV